ncbi:cAMP-dependent protein kinase type I regulatory subunit, partial [Diplonema papillatum]
RQAGTTTDYTYYNKKFDGFCFGDHSAESKEEGSDQSSDYTGPALHPPKEKRGAVSAEDEILDNDFVPPVIQKTDAERVSIERVLHENILFSSLEGNRRALNVVVDAMEKKVYGKGDQVMLQGEIGGEHWYIIEQGEVDIVKDQKVVASFAKGQGFGEMELMYATTTAASVVVSSDELVCWRLGRNTYRYIVMDASRRKREVCKQALQGVDFLQSMTEWQQDHLADALQPCSFNKGECIVQRGRTPSSIHFITEGECTVFREDGTEVCNLGKGELIGELEFLNQHAVVADVYAATNVSTFRLSQEHFELCLGPVKTFLHNNTQTDKYKYYRELRSHVAEQKP